MHDADLTVFASGDPRARLMLVGEGPGAEEDRQGLPFVGAAGELLNKILAAIGLARDEVYVANIVKCRPPGNRDPEPDEVRACRGYLETQIDLVRPAVLVALGRIAAQTLLGTDALAHPAARRVARPARHSPAGHLPPGRAAAQRRLEATDVGRYAARAGSPAVRWTRRTRGRRRRPSPGGGRTR